MANRRYSAFISYRHADNTGEGRRWAEWLHQSLETYQIPPDLIGTENIRGEPVPSTLYPVFRDEVELPAEATLNDSIQRALEASTTLVVLCSPRAVQSRFVDDEIRLFKEMGRADRILALIIDGEPNADDAGKRAAGLDPNAECFPNALRHGVSRPDKTIDWTARTEPIAADVRPGNRPGQGFTTAETYGLALKLAGKQSEAECQRLTRVYADQLRLAFHKVVAGIIGVPTGILTKRDEVYRREKRQRLWKLAGAVAAAFLAIGGFAWFKSHEQNRLLEDSARAEVVTARGLWSEHNGPAALAHLARALGYVPQHPDAISAAVAIAESSVQWDSRLEGREHKDWITSAWYSPDGRRFLTTSKDGSARLWEAEFGTPMQVLDTAAKPIRGGAFRPDGAIILTFSEDVSPRIWDTATGRPLRTLAGHTAAVSTGAFSPDGRVILTGSVDGTVRVWDAASGGELRVSDLKKGSIRQAVFSPDGRRILVATDGGVRQVWDAGNLAEAPWEIPFDAQGKENFFLNRAAFSPDGRWLLAAASPSTITLWDVELRKLLASVGFSDFVKAVFSPDGRHVCTISVSATPQVFSLPRFELRKTLAGHHGTVEDAAFSPDGLRIATAGWDHTLRLWDLWPDEFLVSSAEASRAVLYSHRDRVTTVSFSPDGRSLLSGSFDHSVRQWDAVPGGTADKPWALDHPLGLDLDFIFFQGETERKANLLPKWFPNFLTWLGGVRLDANGEVQNVSLAERDQLRKQLARQALSQERDRYLYLLRWAMQPPAGRALGAFRGTTRKQAAQDFIFLQTEDHPVVVHDMRTAYWLDPAHPLIHLILALQESDEEAADFLRRYSLDRLADDPLLQLVAAEILVRQKQPAWALGYVERVRWHLQDQAKVTSLGQNAPGMQQEAARLRTQLRAELNLTP